MNAWAWAAILAAWFAMSIIACLFWHAAVSWQVPAVE
jgi:hypothetical protein